MISVVIPIYNVEKYIEGCICSVIKQSIRSFELILVDDGTSDRSAVIAEQLLKSVQDIRWQIIHTENRGVSAARNTGIRASNGEYIIMVDADDILSPSFLEDVLSCTKVAPESCIFSSGFTVVSEDKANIFHSVKQKIRLKQYSSEEAIAMFESRKLKFLLPTLLLRKDFLIENGIFFDETVRYSEDVQFIWRCLFNNRKPVVHLPVANYNYILHGSSTMTASGVEKILTGFNGLARLAEEYRGMLSDEVCERIICLMCFSLLHGAAKMLTYQNFDLLFRKSGSFDKLKIIKNGDIRYNVISQITKVDLRLGYSIMRQF